MHRSNPNHNSGGSKSCQGASQSDAAVCTWSDHFSRGQQPGRMACGLTNLRRDSIGSRFCKRGNAAFIMASRGKQACNSQVRHNL